MKKIIFIILALILIGGLAGMYFYYKPTASLEDQQPVATLTADSIFSAFETNEAMANQSYLDKVIVVSGKVQSVTTDTSGTAISLETSSGMFGVTCKLEPNSKVAGDYKTGQQVNLKGICTGYLMDVVLIRCVPAN
ncbi:MAG: hypothetical protein IPJ86_03350 [Bacteroidetes bacterium]|jgi:uncharacterized protein YxeA|nr:hypothetical protein [Bacteroidota bacterium]